MGNASWIRVVLAGVVLTLAFAPPSRAGDEAERDELTPKVEALASAVEDHDRADDVGALRKDVAATLALYEECAGKDPWRKELMALFKTLLKAAKDEGLTRTTLEALGTCKDPDAPKLVKPYLRQRNRKEGDPTLSTAIGVAAQLPDPALVTPLLTLVEKSKHYGTAAEAIKTLGHYGVLKRHREKILLALVKTVEKNKPGGPPRASRGGQPTIDPSAPVPSAPSGKDSGPGARWAALAPVLPGALNRMTNQDLADIFDWFDMVKENKKNLKVLFNDPN